MTNDELTPGEQRSKTLLKAELFGSIARNVQVIWLRRHQFGGWSVELIGDANMYLNFPTRSEALAALATIEAKFPSAALRFDTYHDDVLSPAQREHASDDDDLPF